MLFTMTKKAVIKNVDGFAIGEYIEVKDQIKHKFKTHEGQIKLLGLTNHPIITRMRNGELAAFTPDQIQKIKKKEYLARCI